MRATSAASSGRAALIVSARSSIAQASRNPWDGASRKCSATRELATTHAPDADPDQHGTDCDERTSEYCRHRDHRSGVADVFWMNNRVDHRAAAKNTGAKTGRYEKEQADDHQGRRAGRAVLRLRGWIRLGHATSPAISHSILLDRRGYRCRKER